MKRLIKNTAYYSIGNFTSKALSFLLLPIYLKYLNPSDYGIVNSMQVFTSVIIIFLTFGLERSIYRLIFDYETVNDKKNFLGTISISIFIISIFICSVLLLFPSLISSIYTTISFSPYFVYSIITAFFMTFELVPLISFQVNEKAKEYLLLSIIMLMFRTLPVIWMVVYKQLGAEGMLLGILIGNIVNSLFLIPITISKINLRLDFKILRSTLQYCLPLIPLVLSSWVINMSDRIFIERFGGVEDVGIYSLGYKIGQLVQFMSVAILMAYNPYFYKIANSENQKEAKIKLMKINIIIVSFFIFLCFIVCFFSKDIIVLFFNPEYWKVINFIPIIVVGYFFMQLVSLQNLSFHQNKRTKEIMNINIASALINLILNFFLIERFGIWGAAYSTLITQFLLFLFVNKYSKKYYHVPFKWNHIIILMISLSIVFFASKNIEVSFVNIILKVLFLVFIFSFFYFKRKSLISFIK